MYVRELIRAYQHYYVMVEPAATLVVLYLPDLCTVTKGTHTIRRLAGLILLIVRPIETRKPADG